MCLALLAPAHVRLGIRGVTGLAWMFFVVRCRVMTPARRASMGQRLQPLNPSGSGGGSPPFRSPARSPDPLLAEGSGGGGTDFAPAPHGRSGDTISFQTVSGEWRELTALQVSQLVAENDMLKAQVQFLKVANANLEQEVAQFKGQRGGGGGRAPWA